MPGMQQMAHKRFLTIKGKPSYTNVPFPSLKLKEVYLPCFSDEGWEPDKFNGGHG